MQATTTPSLALGGGCFWCLDAVYAQVPGVLSVQSGYSNGQQHQPGYEDVCRGDTGHAEVVLLHYDPARISLRQILSIFFTIHDPTTLNRQGHDVGTQYRSGIYTTSPEQLPQVQAFVDSVRQSDAFDAPIVTEVMPLHNYWPAEDYHQDFYARNPNYGYCQAVINPKLQHLRQVWKELMPSTPKP
ncbi:peptide-methionine (S)-S-oxide reductase MsrA [Curvibacter sp. CHRR-16]|uniref:peptide-methionine (S)-S-oxide reductase MsrA n=1 Tax=Curvibacter sp. CHRR-16 TaxID=2835872 RepID=UPI001BD97131|nr:peptide-methionine (S)-S-oxide reductase MsrA [Curvibacter sp. CHRR-16]MBT0570974.1 peptide-methionine (S)-S-oxide reductase MsrA [Curvibacter sp. CHRR-16]